MTFTRRLTGRSRELMLAGVAGLALAVAGCGGGAGDTAVPASGGPTGGGSGSIGLSEEAAATISLTVTDSPLAGTYSTSKTEEAPCGRGEENGVEVARVRFTAAAPGPGQLASASIDVPDTSKAKGLTGTIAVLDPKGTKGEVVLDGLSTINYGALGTGYTIKGKATLADGTKIDLRVSCGPF